MKVLLIDDHPLFIEGMGYLFKQFDEPIELTKANSAQAAMAVFKQEAEQDLVLLDLNMPGMDGLALLQRLQAEELDLPVLIMSSETRTGLIRQALDLGAMGFIPKSFTPEQIRDGIEQVLQGLIYLPPSIQVQLARLPAKPLDNEVFQQWGISAKQRQVLGLLARGYSNEQIASSLHRTEHTIKSHVAALFQALGAKSRTECVKLARQAGIVENE